MDRAICHHLMIGAAFADVIALLRDDPQRVLQKATTTAAQHADTTIATLQVRVAGLEIERDVRIEVGRLEPLGAHAAALPLSWRAASRAGLFPSLRGELEVAALSHHPPLTQLSFVGTYRPPLGLLGAAGHAVIGHGFAEAVIERFLDDVAVRVGAQLADRAQAVV